MSLSVVATVADARPMQKGVETEARAFDQLMGAAQLAELEALYGAALAIIALVAQTEVKVEPASDRVKLSVEGASGVPHAVPHAAPRVRS